MSRFSNSDLPRPDDFPVGSPESRAAARALLEERSHSEHAIEIEIRMTDEPPRFYEMPIEDGDRMWRVLSYPSSMERKEALRILRVKNWRITGPTPPNCMVRMLEY